MYVRACVCVCIRAFRIMVGSSCLVVSLIVVGSEKIRLVAHNFIFQ